MGITGYIRSALKFLIFGSVLIIYGLISIFITALSGFNFKNARPRLAKLVAVISRIGLKIIGVKVVKNIYPVDLKKNYLIVSNHLSYVDILVISSFIPSCFITSKEMKRTFFLGQLCLLGGCVFVDRVNRKNLRGEINELSEALKKELNIVLFPEAASTDGTLVNRFRRPLFQAAIESDSHILPICLNYKSIDGTPVTLKNRDTVFWYGENSFINHAIKLFCYKKIVVELNILPGLNANEFADKNMLSDKCHQMVSSCYYKIIA